MSTIAASQAPPSQAPAWFHNPVVDLLIGCGLWSLPLLALTNWVNDRHSTGLALFFYAAMLFCNNPHYMATIYRAYGTNDDFRKYRFFTIYGTGLFILTAILTHWSPLLLPWFFTFYITWSPYHYMGQNFGLTMMFARRNGAQLQPMDRNAIYYTYLGSWLILFLSMHSMHGDDPYFISLGPLLGVNEGAVIVVRKLLLAVVGVLGAFALFRIVATGGVRPMVGTLALFSTQFLWFIAPAVLDLVFEKRVPAVYFATGILAFMHCAQYLWITHYYTKREWEAGKRGGGRPWRPWAYYGTLVVGGIALFLPGPWLVSTIFRHDLTQSILIFSALVNVHHFMLDGAIWKLRDGKVAALLLKDPKNRTDDAKVDGALTAAAAWLAGRSPAARALRWSAVCFLIAVAAIDQVRNYLTRSDAPIEQIELADKLVPAADAKIHVMRAQHLSNFGYLEDAFRELEKALTIDRYNARALRERGRLEGTSGMIDAAYETFQTVSKMYHPDVSTLINAGIVALQKGRRGEAQLNFEEAIARDPDQVAVYLYLADLYMAERNPKLAARHYETFLTSVTPEEFDRIPGGPRGYLGAALKCADAFAASGDPQNALRYAGNVAMHAAQLGDGGLQSQAVARSGDFLELMGRFPEAGQAFRESIRIAAAAKDRQAEAINWFAYGQHLEKYSGNLRWTYAAYAMSAMRIEEVGDQARLNFFREAQTRVAGRLRAEDRSAIDGALELVAEEALAEVR